MIGIGIAEIMMIFIVLLLYLVPIALILAALYYIIKNAVKKGVLEANEEIKRNESTLEKDDV